MNQGGSCVRPFLPQISHFPIPELWMLLLFFLLSISFIMLKIRRPSFLGQINHVGISSNDDISDCLDCDMLVGASNKRLQKVSPLFLVFNCRVELLW